MAMTELQEASKALRYWLKRAGVTGWRVKVMYGSENGAQATIHYDCELRRAAIEINRLWHTHGFYGSVGELMRHEAAHIVLADFVPEPILNTWPPGVVEAVAQFTARLMARMEKR